MWAFLVLSHFLTLPLMRTVKVALSVSSSCLWCREGAGWFRSSHVVVTWLTFGIMPNLGLLFQDCLGVLGCLVSWLCSRLIPIRFDARHRKQKGWCFFMLFLFFFQSGAVFLAICYILGLKSLICVLLLHFGLKSLICVLFAAFWSQNLWFACYLLHFGAKSSLICVLFAAFLN